MTTKDAASPRITISEADLNALLDRREDERDAALAENARLRTALVELRDAADFALRKIDGYDAILDELAMAVNAANKVMR